MMNKERKIELFKEKCQTKGIKLTPQRLLIYEELINSTEHPTAERIYSSITQKFPTISLDTVHRTLETFCTIGVATMAEGLGNSKRFEGNMDNHHHVHCVQCGMIHDVYDANYDQLLVPPQVSQEFKILKKIVHLEGICRKCQTEYENMD
ncbi:MAG: transcriptional repressor [Desulfobacterales bacterium]|nr:transcriptional repressor [Desulfobacterales bacterium]